MPTVVSKVKKVVLGKKRTVTSTVVMTSTNLVTSTFQVTSDGGTAPPPPPPPPPVDPGLRNDAVAVKVTDVVSSLTITGITNPDLPPAGVFHLTAPGGDATTAIQNALDTHADVYFNAGTFSCNSALFLNSGNRLWLDQGATIVKNFSDSGNGATSSAFIRTRNMKVAINDVKVIGLGNGNANITAGAGKTGNMFSVWCNSFVCKNWQTTNWIGGRHSCIVGDDVHYDNINWTAAGGAGSGSGGLRFMGGDNLLCENSTIISGDDVYQFVPAGAVNDPFFNCPDITNGLYRNCTGRSYEARLCVAGLQDSADDGTTNLGMKISVKNCRFENISGFSGHSAFVHQNKSSTGIISGTTTSNVVIDRTDATLGQAGEIFMNGVSATGGVDNINLSGVTIIGHRADGSDKPIYAQQGKVTNIVRPPQSP